MQETVDFRKTRKGEKFIDDPDFHWQDYEWESIQEKCALALHQKHGDETISKEKQCLFLLT